MAETPKPHDLPIEQPEAMRAPLWTGAGLCCEAQGDGVPCRGTDGECESCGRALPPPAAADEA